MEFTEVYIEDVILDNLFLSFIILFFSAKLLKIHRKTIFYIISAIIGVIFTLFNLYISLSAALLFLYKFLTATIMVLIAYKFQNFKQFMLSFFTFIFVTALIGGLCFFVLFSFGETVFVSGNTFYQLSIPIWLIILILFVVGFLIFKITDSMRLRNLNANFIYKTNLQINEKKFNLLAFLDTGNTLIDSISGKPINIISYKNFQKIYRDIPLYKILIGEIPKNLKNAHYINVGTIGQKTKMLVFEIDLINIKQKNKWQTLKNVYIAVSFIDLEKKLSCGMLLNPKMFQTPFI